MLITDDKYLRTLHVLLLQSIMPLWFWDGYFNSLLHARPWLHSGIIFTLLILVMYKVEHITYNIWSSVHSAGLRALMQCFRLCTCNIFMAEHTDPIFDMIVRTMRSCYNSITESARMFSVFLMAMSICILAFTQLPLVSAGMVPALYPGFLASSFLGLY